MLVFKIPKLFHGLPQYLSNIENFSLFFFLRCLYSVCYHGQTERTVGNYHFWVGNQQLVCSGIIDTLVTFYSIFLQPHTTATSATAETKILALFDFNYITTCCLKNTSWLIIYTIVSSQETRVMIGYLGCQRFTGFKFSFGYQLGQEFSIMIYLIIPTHLRVFILQCIIAMRTNNYYFLNPIVVERFQVLLYQSLI